MKQELIKRLNDTHGEIFTLFEFPERVLKLKPDPAKWSAKEILFHLADAEAAFLDRLKRLIAIKNPVLQAYDQDGFCSALNYQERPFNSAKALFHACRSSFIELTEAFYDTCKDNIGEHSENGPITFGSIVEKCARHSDVHVKQLRDTIG